jgi:hypothetical protein
LGGVSDRGGTVGQCGEDRMIFPDGYVPFYEAFEIWVHQNLKHRQLLDEGGFVLEQQTKEARNVFESAVNLFCADVEQDIPMHIQMIDGPLYRITGKVCKHFNEVDLCEVSKSFHDRLWGVSDQIDDDEPDYYPPFTDYYDLPNLEGNRFLYINPNLSIIDCAGADFVYEFLRDEYDAADHDRLETAAEERRYDDEKRSSDQELSKVMHYRDVMDLFGSVIDRSQAQYERFQGNSICFNIASLMRALNSLYPLDLELINRTISNEKKAERDLRQYMAANPPTRPTREFAQSNILDPLGKRAFDRVWNAVKVDFPQLGQPGKPRSRKPSH